jgi:hypothetical protein
MFQYFDTDREYLVFFLFFVVARMGESPASLELPGKCPAVPDLYYFMYSNEKYQ